MAVQKCTDRMLGYKLFVIGLPGPYLLSAASHPPRWGNLLTWDEQRQKLELVSETTRAVWG